MCNSKINLHLLIEKILHKHFMKGIYSGEQIVGALRVSNLEIVTVAETFRGWSLDTLRIKTQLGAKKILT